MENSVLKYRLYCETDSKYEYLWVDGTQPEPTKCPVDTSHTIRANSVSVVDKIDSNVVVVEEEIFSTGGNYQAEGKKFAISATVGYENFDFSFPMDISLLSSEINLMNENDGDEAELQVNPDSNIGDISSDVSVGDTEISVEQSVIDKIKVGHWVKIDDGANAEDLGRVILVDSTLLKITVSNATSNSYLSATPTYIKSTVKMVSCIYLTSGRNVVLGASKIGGSSIKANTIIRARYKNNDGLSKSFIFIMEYLY